MGELKIKKKKKITSNEAYSFEVYSFYIMTVLKKQLRTQLRYAADC